jgi:hypothetical protein
MSDVLESADALLTTVYPFKLPVRLLCRRSPMTEAQMTRNNHSSVSICDVELAGENNKQFRHPAFASLIWKRPATEQTMSAKSAGRMWSGVRMDFGLSTPNGAH